VSAEDVVNEFIKAVTSGDRDRAGELLAEDLVYENIGFGPALAPALPTVNGGAAALDFLAPMQDAEWTVHRQQSFGNVVVNERTDRFTFGEAKIALPVAGIFEVVDGKITFWRDYFETSVMNEQLAGGAG
jgi:limonene-1,2-epoxide hydrolase